MKIEKDGKLIVSASLSNDQLLSFAKEIANKIYEIKSVEIDDGIVESSALFTLLASIKNLIRMPAYQFWTS